ncbi:MAG: protein nirF [Comamonadaceae bacterium]|nr:protein nirF [Comamonadaceae bacterium]
MRRRSLLGTAIGGTLALGAPLLLQGCGSLEPTLSAPVQGPPQGTGDLGVVVQRGRGALTIINTSSRTARGEVSGLGDLSHASVVFSRDAANVYVFGRDGALTKVNLLTQRIVARVQQAGNSIGGAISQDGSLVVAQNYTPGGIKVFDAKTLALVADIPAETASGQRSRVVGLRDLPGRRFIFSLFDADAIWIADLSEPTRPRVTRFEGIGRQPYDALITPNGRHYIAGLFGEDGFAMIDLWEDAPKVRRILADYGRGGQPLPVYKMPHLRGWAVAGGQAYLPAIGRHEVLVANTGTWVETARIPVVGQPVFVMARPDGRQVWVNFAMPDYHRVQVIDTVTQRVVRTLEPGKAVMHMEFTPRGEAVWISSRDSNRVSVIDTTGFETLATIDVDAPSGIFFTARAARVGF